jgi:hypothetical protein
MHSEDNSLKILWLEAKHVVHLVEIPEQVKHERWQAWV